MNWPTFTTASTISPFENLCCILNKSGGKTLASRFSSWISPKIPRCLELPKIFSSDFICVAKFSTCSFVPLIFSNSEVTSFTILFDWENCNCMFCLVLFWNSLIPWLMVLSFPSISILELCAFCATSFLISWISLRNASFSWTKSEFEPEVFRFLKKNIVSTTPKMTSNKMDSNDIKRMYKKTYLLKYIFLRAYNS